MCQGREELPVGAPLARLTRPGEQSVPKAPKAAPEAIPVSVPLAVEVGRAPGTQAAPLASFVQPSSRPRASPAARRRAGELGIDLNTLKGTGFDGSVTLADVELAAAGGAPPKALPLPRPLPHAAEGSIQTRCGWPSRRPCRARSGKSRTTISRAL
ncbi:E3 binding domain-containing protein [Mesorhizobium atlanticum]